MIPIPCHVVNPSCFVLLLLLLLLLLLPSSVSPSPRFLQRRKGSMCRGLASAYGGTRGRGSTGEWVPATSARALRHLGTQALARDGKRYIRSTTAVWRTEMKSASETWTQV
ncbi:hypothetical protein V8C44DRAFT_336942 [Trichoderma aethiopicum]